MNFWLRLKKLQPRQLIKLASVLCKKPHLIFPTLQATKKTLLICNEHFGKAHHKNNPPNAFRHALWNILICEAAYKKDNNLKEALNWAKTITDLHEEFAFSTELAKAMDLHNNTIGRQYFEAKFATSLPPFSINEIITFLKEKALNSKIIDTPTEEKKYPDSLVFIA